ncbi:MAG: translation elongation factor [Pseudonocardiales bacterium]|nr:translation elongation factor [Pseudonocardiales bacterium]
MRVVATAGHVDHGKSTLVRALTGMEPDRWAEERRRGMTIDLGYAWTQLGGELLAFVDVPGHQRFIGNMLAGLGPAPAVMFVVAADEGWRRQSAEHLDAIDALGLSNGLLVVTRSDLADPEPARLAALGQLEASSLGRVESVSVSGSTGMGLPELRTSLSRLITALPLPVTTGRVRLWIDRAFTIVGSGTVVTGTLGAGRLGVGDELELNGTRYAIRGLQQAGLAVAEAFAVSRVAVNLRGLDLADVGRGDVLLTPSAWPLTAVADARLDRPGELPAELTLHFGTTALAVHTRRLSDELTRLTLPLTLPLAVGDRAILRDPGSQSIVTGVEILDVRPPDLDRRGAARRRAEQLAHGVGATAQVEQRGLVRASELLAMGLDPAIADGRRMGEWLISERQWADWVVRLGDAVDSQAAADPLEPGLAPEAARQLLGLPAPELLSGLIAGAALSITSGRVTRPGVVPSLGRAETAIATLEIRLGERPFAAPERDELTALGLGPRELAVAVATNRLLRLADDVFLLPRAPALAMRELSRLPVSFTLSDARQALSTTRRVAVPLMEYLDARGWTERIDGTHRRIRPSRTDGASSITI